MPDNNTPIHPDRKAEILGVIADALYSPDPLFDAVANFRIQDAINSYRLNDLEFSEHSVEYEDAVDLLSELIFNMVASELDLSYGEE